MYDQTYDCVGVFHNISKLSIFESHKSYVGDADLPKYLHGHHGPINKYRCVRCIISDFEYTHYTP